MLNLNILEEKAIKSKTSNIKQLLDIVISLFVIIFSLILLPLILYMYIKNRGKLFFFQERIGLDGKIFICYKFKTMKDTILKNEFKPVTDNDLRVDKFGAFMRKFNLDELPQIINVFKGDMSIVGPRPHSIIFHKKYKSFCENIDLRLKVKPGITGLAQIKGLRGDVLDEEVNKIRILNRVNTDIKYINNWSNYYDIKIILITILQIFKLKNQGI